MKRILEMEELALFGLGIYGFSRLSFAWWWFPALILVPDLGMIGYVWNDRVGAITYNILHHKGLAVILFLAGIYLNQELLQLAGIIMFSHASMDRVFGYGLKYLTGFKYTHLGMIGKSS
jgi:hypothetical protein